MSDAALVKELAIRGARTLPVDATDERLHRLIVRTGARAPRGRIQDYLKRRQDLDQPVISSGQSITEILDELREDKI